MTDPVADLLTRIRNAVMADYDHALAPASRLNTEFARLLKDEGYIEGYSIERMRPPRGRRRRSGKTEFDMLHIRLKYAEDRTPVISGLKRISKPGRRRYVKADELPRVLGGMGTAVITTSGGVMTAYEAQQKRLGGEVVAYIW